jgi:hypothetical protein
MVKEKFAALAIVFVLALFACANIASAFANYTLTTPFSNIGQNSTFNLSIGAIGGSNITKVVISWTGSNSTDSGEMFLAGTNGTTATGTNFTNLTVLYNITASSWNHNVTLNFTNTTAAIIANGTAQNFWINFRARSAESLVQITVNVTNQSGSANWTTFTLYPAFAFSGIIVNETGCATCGQNNTNVSIYGTVPNPNGPRTSRLLANTATNASGYFRLQNINITSSGTFDGYQLKTVFYNSNGTATKVGAPMPDFPRFMYYGTPSGGSINEGFDMTLNGGTFYLQPAVTLNFSAHNGTTQVSFGYEVIDQDLGFPIESNTLDKVKNVQVIVPAGRGYVISFFRMFGFSGSNTGYFMNNTFCTGDFMNDSHCPAPPKSANLSSSNAAAEGVFIFNQSLIVRKAQITGCINIASGANNTALNVTKVGVKMLPWSTSTGSFIPPRSGNDGSVNTTFINYTNSVCNFAFYNFSLLNNTGYLIELYAKNASSEAGNPGTSAFNLAGFFNLTTRDDNAQRNVTLYRLAGSYINDSNTGVETNTSMIKINIVNSSGSIVTTPVNANLKVKNSAAGLGTLYYIINVQNGSFYIPMLNNSNFAKAMIFSQNGPPRESSINLSASEVNITIVSMGSEKGFRKFNPNGTLEVVDTSSIPIQMRFLRTEDACDVPNAPSSCEITSMNASGFNPLKVMLAGKVNMEIKITSTNVSLIFHDYDMMSAKQPPMNSIMNENATGRSSSGTALQDTWNFGSFAPADSYKNVTIVIPYSDSQSASTYINESAVINASIPVLYDDNQNVVWNISRGDAPDNLTDDLIEYNNTFFRSLINSSTGIICNTTDTSGAAYANTTGNYIVIKVPHFSTIGANVYGSGAGSSVTPSDNTSSSSSTGGGDTSDNSTTSGWTLTYAQDDQELSTKASINKYLKVNERIRIKVESQSHYVGVVALTSTKATINVSSDPQQAELSSGSSKKFEVTNDNYYDMLVTLNSINSANTTKANITITYLHELISVNMEVPKTNSTSTATGNQSAAGAGGSSIVTKTIIWMAVVVIVLVLGGIIFYWYIKEVKKHPWKFEERVKVRDV